MSVDPFAEGSEWFKLLLVFLKLTLLVYETDVVNLADKK